MNDTSPVPLRAAIYARSSSTLQNPRSVEDQVRLCRDKLHDIGAVVTRIHSDPAASGTTTRSRPGLKRLLQDAKYGLVDLVCAEALDRISRDQEDIAGIYKRLRFWNVRLFTLQEGEIQSIHVGIGGPVNQAWIENLAFKTRRGQIGAVFAGRIPGGLCYGYRIDEEGKPRRAGEESARRQERLKAGVADGQQRIARLLDSIEQGAQSHAAHRRILDIEHETAAIQLELDTLPEIPERATEDLATRLHDRLAELSRVTACSEPGEDSRRRALLLARDLIERIDIAPLPGRGQVDISVLPRTDALVAFALDDEWTVTPEAQEE